MCCMQECAVEGVSSDGASSYRNHVYRLLYRYNVSLMLHSCIPSQKRMERMINVGFYTEGLLVLHPPDETYPENELDESQRRTGCNCRVGPTIESFSEYLLT